MKQNLLFAEFVDLLRCESVYMALKHANKHDHVTGDDSECFGYVFLFDLVKDIRESNDGDVIIDYNQTVN